MNKADLINLFSEKIGISKKQAEEAIELFVDTVIDTLKKGGEVTLAGFGTFSARKRAAREGVNPQNPTEKIHIPATTVAKFKAGKRLKDELKG